MVVTEDWRQYILDSLPLGWLNGFGPQLIAELEPLVTPESEFRLDDVKEKWGRLTIYFGAHENYDAIDEVIEKYADISSRTCIICGKPATCVATGWIMPLCDDCAETQGVVTMPIK